MKVAIYLRVSTEKAKDGSGRSVRGQTPENQLLQINQMVNARGWEVAKTYTIFDSASKQLQNKQFYEMLEDARVGMFNALIVWSLDRFSREGARKTFKYIEELEHWKVGFISYTEQWLDTLGPWKDMVLAMLATMAKQESTRMSERTRAAIERVRASGKRWGRPTNEATCSQVVELREKKGMSWPKIAHRLRCGQATAIRRYREARPQWHPLQKQVSAHRAIPLKTIDGNSAPA